MKAGNTEAHLKRILHSFMSAQEDEADCNECYEHLDKFVEMVDAGEDAATIMPRIESHLKTCHCCHEEYRALLAILRSEVDA